MTNREKLLKDNPILINSCLEDIIAFVRGQPRLCAQTECSRCDFWSVQFTACDHLVGDWLNKEAEE